MKETKKEKFILNKIYTFKNSEVKGLRGKLFLIDLEGYYCFKITTRNSEIEEFWTKTPIDDVILKGRK